MDSPKRSIIKTITWRFIAFFITMAAVYCYNSNIKESFLVSLVANAVKMILYYMHERVWNNIDFGRTRPDYEI